MTKFDGIPVQQRTSEHPDSVQRTRIQDTNKTDVNPATSDIQTDGTQKTGLVFLKPSDGSTNDVTTQNPLPVRDFEIDAALGRITGYSVIHKYGRNSAVGASDEAVTSNGTINWLTTPTTVRIKAGGNVNDTAAGTGAREITVIGLDENFAEASESITTNGTSASTATTTTFIRVFRAYVTSVGMYTGVNAGNIVIENSGGGTDLIIIEAGEGQTQFGAYTIPAGKTGYLMSIYSTVDASKNGSVKMWARNNADDTTVPYSPKRLKLFFDGLVGGNMFKTRTPVNGMVFGEKTDVWFTAISDATGSAVSVDFEILLVDN